VDGFELVRSAKTLIRRELQRDQDPDVTFIVAVLPWFEVHVGLVVVLVERRQVGVVVTPATP
jgi:hypothetical protein